MNMKDYKYITIKDMPSIKEKAAMWFANKWKVPESAYLEAMEDYINGKTDYGWYLCINEDEIIGGLGVVDNDFHNRKDLTPNICAVYTEKAYRNQGIAGRLLNIAVEDLRQKGISPVYLVTDHANFYERYGWEYLCMILCDNECNMSRMYIHR